MMAIIVTLLVQISILMLIPVWRRRLWKKTSPQLIELRDNAVDLENENWCKNLGNNDLKELEGEVELIQGLVLTEIVKISKTIAKRYNRLNMVDITPFEDIIDRRQRALLGNIRQTWQMANQLIDKYTQSH
ncbi:hypothetical protein ACFLXP_05630 [Chloroflexota bacterium]